MATSSIFAKIELKDPERIRAFNDEIDDYLRNRLDRTCKEGDFPVRVLHGLLFRILPVRQEGFWYNTPAKGFS